PLAVPGGRPEPDLALAETTTSRAHPQTAELVVEVAITSLNDDLAKLPGYADAGVDVVWLVDVPARTVRVFVAPHSRRYQRDRVDVAQRLRRRATESERGLAGPRHDVDRGAGQRGGHL